MSTRLTVRLDFATGHRLGPGKIALLEGVRKEGSIAAAGRALGMSYRRAWLLIAELNTMFAEPIVHSRPGGKSGGGAQLTESGERLLDSYRTLERRLVRGGRADITAIETMLRSEPLS